MTSHKKVGTWLIFFICVGLLLGCKRKRRSKPAPKARAGVLDLRKVDFSAPIALDGSWSLGWGVLQRPGQPRQKPKIARWVNVPGSWSKAPRKQKKLPAVGVATYRLLVLLPYKRPKKLMLRISRVTSAYEFWVNGRKLASRGVVGKALKDSAMNIGNTLVALPSSSRLNLTVLVSNHRHRVGGLRRSWVIGKASDILVGERWSHAVHATIVAVIFSIGCLFLVLGGLRRDVSWLWFAAFCLTTATRASLSNGALTMQALLPWLDTIGQLRLEYSSIFFINACILGVFGNMFPKQMSRRIVLPVMLLATALSASAFVLPLRWVLGSLPLFGMLSAVSVSMVLWIIVQAWLEEEELAGLILSAFTIALLAFVHDFARAMGLMLAPVELAPISFFLFIFVQTYALALRFAKSFDRIKQLSDELQVAHKKLQKTHQETLEELEDLRQMGNYQLNELLGSGGMGEVWKASHRLLARPAAVKLIRPEQYNDSVSQGAARFEREAQTTALLRSPHTVELYDFGQSPKGEFYYAMELLDGIDLDDFVLQYGPMDPARVLYVLHQACLSLAEAHAADLVHRDIKPANLFLCRMGEQFDFVKILDFGLVKPLAVSGNLNFDGLPVQGTSDSAAAYAETAEFHQRMSQAELVTSSRSSSQGGSPNAQGNLTALGVITGTPAFMPPEQIQNKTLDGRTDLYALGCVAYWLLSGRTVFDIEEPIEVLKAHLLSEPPDLSEVAPQPIPAELVDLVHQCLAKKQDDRPENARALMMKLEELTGSYPWTNEDARQWWSVHLPEHTQAIQPSKYNSLELLQTS